MFFKFFMNDPYARLTTLRVVFMRTLHYDRGQIPKMNFPISIRKTEGYGLSPLDGGFVFDDPGQWIHDDENSAGMMESFPLTERRWAG